MAARAVFAGLLCAHAGEPARAEDFTLVPNGIIYFSADCSRGVGQGRVWNRGVPGSSQINDNFNSLLTGLSGDGSTIVGYSFGGVQSQPRYWVDFMQPSMTLPNGAPTYQNTRTAGVNSNGSVIVGSGEVSAGGLRVGFIWNRSQPTVTLTTINPLPGDTWCYAQFTSGDGSVVVGDSSRVTMSSQITTAFAYRRSTSPQLRALLPLPVDSRSAASGLSRNGRWAVGSSFRVAPGGSSNIFTGVYWDTLVGTAIATPANFSPLAVNADGTVVLGNASLPGQIGGTVAVWRRSTNQIYDINLLAASLGISTDGWVMSYARAISDDGLTFACTVEKPSMIAGAVLRFNCFDGPVLTSSPNEVVACATASASFAVTTSSASPVTYAWRRSAVPLNTGAHPSAATATLTLSNVSSADAGSYDCVVTNACGTVTSDSATLTILPGSDPTCRGATCDPDLNQDGNADQGDIDYLINVIAGGENPTNVDPDFNLDGNSDQGDIDALVNVIAGGQCP